MSAGRNNNNQNEGTSRVREMTKKLRLDVSLVGVLMIIIGIIMFIAPIATTSVFIYILGILLLIGGIVTIINYIRFRTETTVLRLILGLILIFLGIWLMAAPIDVMVVICFVFAVYLFASGIQNIFLSIELKRSGHQKIFIPILFSILTIVFALILLTNLFTTVFVSIKVISIFLIIDGIFSLFFAGSLIKYTRAAEQAAENTGGSDFGAGADSNVYKASSTDAKNMSFKIRDDVEDAEYTEVSDSENE